MRWPKPMIRSFRASASRGLRDDRQRGGREASQIFLRLVVVDVDQLSELPPAAERRECRLEVRHVAAGAELELAVRRRQTRLERLVDEEAPHLLEGDLADEVLDVDAAIAELTALFVRLRDLRLEGHDAGEARAELVHAWISSNSISKPTSRSRAAANTSAAAAMSWTATPTDLYSVISTGVARPRLLPL